MFNWTDCYHNLSPKERVDEILDEFYQNNEWIQRGDDQRRGVV
jgi:hypothetical protein